MGTNKLKLISALIAASFILSGCSVLNSTNTPTEIESSIILPTPDLKPKDNIKEKPDFGWTTLEEFYAQEPEWIECGDGEFLCSPIYAPLDWDNPSAGMVYLALFKKEATGPNPIGSLLVNPGGPGSSGVDLVYYASEYITTPAVREQYDIIGFDPRGVGFSDSVYCGEGELIDEVLLSPGPEPDLGSEKSLEESRQIVKVLAEACFEGTGELLGYIDTKSSARDMDLIRHVVGDKKLNYLGFSYGTQLGATYAALYPENVGRMVLDAAVVPTQNPEQGTIGQAGGFELAFNNYIKDCLIKKACPGGSTESEVRASVKELLLQLETEPLKTNLDEDLSVWTALTGIIANLYSQSNWTMMSAGIADALEGDGTSLLESAYRYFERTPEGEYLTNTMMANIAINCMDGRYPDDPESIKATNEAIKKAAPLFGRYFANPHIACHGWKYDAKPSTNLDYRVKLNYPVMVIGTTGDPATPYQSAVELAELLNEGFLVTYEGEGHTVYANNSVCIDAVVDAYLLNGTVPSKEVICK